MNIMMDDGEILRRTQGLSERGNATRDESARAFDSGDLTELNTAVQIPRKYSALEVLCGVGAVVAFLVFVFLLSWLWPSLRSDSRILVPLGWSAATFLVGLTFAFSHNRRLESVSSSFFLFSVLLAANGLQLVLELVGLHGYYLPQILIAGLLLVSSLLSSVYVRRGVFVLLSIVFGTWLFCGLTSTAAYSLGVGDAEIRILTYSESQLLFFWGCRLIFIGLAYVVLGHLLSKRRPAPLTSVLYGVGTFLCLGTAVVFSGTILPITSPNVFWMVAFLVLVVGALFLSVRIRSRSVVFSVVLCSIFFTFFVTWQYLIWPIIVLVLIWVGYSYWWWTRRKHPSLVG
ncbi:hypothetical protein A2480_04280 [Candidatus Uhrbacteria bacterium RIFOXYC2_FULL_47_19]|uniref:DUF2157 domain-containing protein n=1 Tax=Candidatus Uhrbacteria bacterium RIFOXYC2_FULL_47_19 TaxID=1802424 RepID=A0A1F7WC90_9BACT|nr:MAG: hypothetical protein A2480_04280 [Candidatus Uhrbacteria bacterium RIFOXYC2_FULL_47_19]